MYSPASYYPNRLLIYVRYPVFAVPPLYRPSWQPYHVATLVSTGLVRTPLITKPLTLMLLDEARSIDATLVKSIAWVELPLLIKYIRRQSRFLRIYGALTMRGFIPFYSTPLINI